MPIYQLGDEAPQLESDVFIAPTAAVIGRVVLASRSSVWWNATVRGDTEGIFIGPRSNIQDGAVVHADPGFPTNLGRGVTVGHGATIHGCTIGDYSLVGIGATVLNGARIGRNCLIGAHALVTEGTVVEDGSLVVGVPARVKRSLSDKEIRGLMGSSDRYVRNGARYARELTLLLP